MFCILYRYPQCSSTACAAYTPLSFINKYALPSFLNRTLCFVAQADPNDDDLNHGVTEVVDKFLNKFWLCIIC